MVLLGYEAEAPSHGARSPDRPVAPVGLGHVAERLHEAAPPLAVAVLDDRQHPRVHLLRRRLVPLHQCHGRDRAVHLEQGQ
eukprot:4834948-Lingulodinium_polyedra.AAC.1